MGIVSSTCSRLRRAPTVWVLAGLLAALAHGLVDSGLFLPDLAWSLAGLIQTPAPRRAALREVIPYLALFGKDEALDQALEVSNQDIADYLGLTIETVSRAFGKLRREGVIDIYSAHTVEILDRETVEELALAD